MVQSYGTSGGGPAPMQIDVVTWKDKGSSKAKARTTRKASPRVKGNGMVALAKEKGDWSNPGQGRRTMRKEVARASMFVKLKELMKNVARMMLDHLPGLHTGLLVMVAQRLLLVASLL